MTVAALAALLAAVPAAGQEAPPVEGTAVDTSETKAARELVSILEEDPEAAEVLAARILDSSLGPALSRSADPAAARREVRDWIKKNPADAASLAVGFAADDASGRDDFEKSLTTRVKRSFALSENRDAGMLGRLGRAAALSKTVGRAAKMDEEEARGLIKRLFEGKSTIDGKVGSAPGGGGGGRGAPEAAGPAWRGGGPAVPGFMGAQERPAVAGGGMYDRLHSANPTGYSPEVLAFQSAMNGRRPPGAPALIETGRLDYPTLRHPYFGLKYDVERLREGYEVQRAWAIARELGVEKEYDARRIADPSVRRALEARLGDRELGAGWTRRRGTLEKSAAALAAFDAEAEKTKTASGITPARIRRLSSLRRDAARWIAVASLEETIARLKAYSGFMTAELRARIARVPEEAAIRSGYARRGERLEARLAAAAADGEKARALLTGADDEGAWAEAERLVAKARAAARELPVRIAEFTDLPARILSLAPPASGWRAVFDRYAAAYLPGIGYSRSLAKKAAERKKLSDAFRRIAAQ